MRRKVGGRYYDVTVCRPAQSRSRSKVERLYFIVQATSTPLGAAIFDVQFGILFFLLIFCLSVKNCPVS